MSILNKEVKITLPSKLYKNYKESISNYPLISSSFSQLQSD